MHVSKLDIERMEEVRGFVHFPFELYRDCPHWAPPLTPELCNAVSRRRHPFYEHSTAEFFTAESEGQILGRIAVMHNRNHNTYREARTAFFGFADVVEEIEVARTLFEAAFAWARRCGLTEIVGPRGLLGWDGGGVLVEGFQYRPAVGVPYNFPYYDAFIRDSGFEKDVDHLSGYFDGQYRLPERLSRIAEKVMQRQRFWIKTFSTPEEMRRWVPKVAAVHQAAFSRNHEYYPPTEKEVDLIADTLISMADPELIKLVMKDGEVVGFILGIHDIGSVLERADAPALEVDWYDLVADRQRSKAINVNGVAMLPAYRGLGGNILLYNELARSLRAFNCEYVEIVQINENNFETRADAEALGITWHKRHRTYRRTLD